MFCWVGWLVFGGQGVFVLGWVPACVGDVVFLLYESFRSLWWVGWCAVVWCGGAGVLLLLYFVLSHYWHCIWLVVVRTVRFLFLWVVSLLRVVVLGWWRWLCCLFVVCCSFGVGCSNSIGVFVVWHCWDGDFGWLFWLVWCRVARSLWGVGGLSGWLFVVVFGLVWLTCVDYGVFAHVCSSGVRLFSFLVCL